MISLKNDNQRAVKLHINQLNQRHMEEARRMNERVIQRVSQIRQAVRRAIREAIKK